MNEQDDRPTTILIGALGGEGGGVLTSWITAAAMAGDLPVQSTSVPGVAQRTGATTYYVEVFPRTNAELAGRRPVFALFPNPGLVDVVVASEQLEAARAMERGFVTPDRTTLIASRHRVYAIGEKSAAADGRFPGKRMPEAAAELAARSIIFDAERIARESRSSLNAVLYGAIAGTGRLPIEDQAFEDAIVSVGKAVDANVRGFRAGLAAARSPDDAVAEDAPEAERRPSPPVRGAEELLAEVRAAYPRAVAGVIEAAVPRLIDYQDRAYARLYLDRLALLLERERSREGDAYDFRLTREAARHLAVWMTFEDVIRVADLKSRPARFVRVRDEAGADADQPVTIVEYLKPGLEEWCAILPAAIGRPLLRWAERRGKLDRFNIGLRVRSSRVGGFLMLFLLARLRPWRRWTLRFKEEQQAIDGWLDATVKAIEIDYRLAFEVVELARARKGYGETRRRGVGKYDRVMDEVVRPILDSGAAATSAVDAVARAREAALNDAEDGSFERALEELGTTAGSTDDAAPRPAPMEAAK